MQEGHQAIINLKLKGFLDNSRLSLSQFAQKLEISKSHLSEIKNGKKDPNLDLGLKILKYCGANTQEKQEWIEQKYLANSREYEEHHHDLSLNSQKNRLSQSISTKLAKDLDLTNIFLDITNSDQNGVSKSYIQLQYGLNGLKKIQYLLNCDLIIEKCGSFFAGNNRLVMTKDASYELLKTVSTDQQNKFHQNELDGKYQFQIDDIDDEGYELIKETFDKYMKEINQIVKNHRKGPQNGGKRYFMQGMIGLIKNTFSCLALLFIITNSNALQAREGGMEGGSSSLTYPNFELETDALDFGFSIEEELNGPKKLKLEKEILIKKCSGFVQFNRAADASVSKIKVIPYWENRVKKYELKVDLKIKCIGNPLNMF